MSHTPQTCRCSFCNRSKREEQIFAGSDVWICASCVTIASDIIEHARNTPRRAAVSYRPATRHCSFCRKSERELNHLCAGPNVYICDVCVGVASGSIARPPSHAREIWSALRRRLGSWKSRGIRYQAAAEPW
jgi:ATP-dependent Clp protease ATP-binding subunit ClpX